MPERSLVTRNARGILFALAAYVGWGLLSPLSSILLQSMGPFTLNAVRTALALPLLVLLFGRRTTSAAVALLRRDVQVWILGGLWLGLTFVPFVWSLRYLPPTITTLTIYFAPLLIAAWSSIRRVEAVTPFAFLAAGGVLGGASIAVMGHWGSDLGPSTWLGLGLAFFSVLGWVAYTVQLKSMSRTRDMNAVTLAAFIASLVPFVAGAAFEGFSIDWDPFTLKFLALHVLVPTSLSFWLYGLALREALATTVAILLGVELASTALVSYLLLDEPFSPTKILGLAIATAAMLAYLWTERRRGAATSHAQASF